MFAQLLNEFDGVRASIRKQPIFFGFIALAASVCMDTTDLTICLLGGSVYALLYASSYAKPVRKDAPVSSDYHDARKVGRAKAATPSSSGAKSKQLDRDSNPYATCTQPTYMPVAAPSFNGTGWESEVQELVGQLLPTESGWKMVNDLADAVYGVVGQVFPGASVTGYLHGTPTTAMAFASAVPVVDIVVDARVRDLRKHVPKGAVLDCSQLQKGAVRFLAEKLVMETAMKFRKSALHRTEPEFILWVPPSMGIAQQGFAINFSVNSPIPERAASLCFECEKFDRRAQELILLVRRWARDRGVAHAVKGHMSPYAWTLLTLYFLQVGMPGCESILPPVRIKTGKSCKFDALAGRTVSDKTTGDLFKDFLNFYASEFDWSREVVSVDSGRRCLKSSSLAMPVVEDPFDAGINAAATITSWGLGRLREELSRAKALLGSPETASLAILLVPWLPPEVAMANPEQPAAAAMPRRLAPEARATVSPTAQLSCPAPQRLATGRSSQTATPR